MNATLDAAIMVAELRTDIAKLKEELTFRIVIVTIAVVGLGNGVLFWMLSNLIHSLKGPPA
jgi:hypothetical protein